MAPPMTTTTTKARRRVNVPLLRKWSRALRSGKYKQGKGQLRDGDNFCCLGVLCDVSGVGKWEDGAYEGNTCVESIAVDKKIGAIAYRIPLYVLGGPNDFTGLNDTLKYTFADIADVVDDFVAAYVAGGITDKDIREAGAGV